MTESRRKLLARAASQTIARQEQFNHENIGNKVHLPVSDTGNYTTAVGILHCTGIFGYVQNRRRVFR